MVALFTELKWKCCRVVLFGKKNSENGVLPCHSSPLGWASNRNMVPRERLVKLLIVSHLCCLGSGLQPSHRPPVPPRFLEPSSSLNHMAIPETQSWVPNTISQVAKLKYTTQAGRKPRWREVERKERQGEDICPTVSAVNVCKSGPLHLWSKAAPWGRIEPKVGDKES